MSKFLYAQYGQADTYWDISFSTDQLDAVDVDEEMMRGISVHVDKETGEVTLNEGYEPGSPQDRAEQALFSEYEEEIKQTLVDMVLSPRLIGDPDYDALRAKVGPRPGL